MESEIKKPKIARLIHWIHEWVEGDQLKIVYIHDGDICTIGLSDSKSKQVFLLGSMFDLQHLINEEKGNGEHYKNMANIVVNT